MMGDGLKIAIKLCKITCFDDLLEVLSPIFQVTKGAQIQLTIDFNNSFNIHAQYLTILVSLVNYIRESGIQLDGKVIGATSNNGVVKYASRMNFFDLLQMNFEEDFNRHSSSGRFVEITRFDESNAVSLCNAIIDVLDKYRVNKEMLAVLDYCLFEVVDNTLRHSKSDGTVHNGSGFLSCQYYPYQKEIRIIVCDTGQGIHKGLTGNVNSKYRDLTEAEAVRQSIEKGVTNSTGMGFGLWATSQLVKENKGELIIHSGEHQLICSSIVSINKTNAWQGTFTYLKINSDVPVQEEKIFDDGYNLVDNFIEKRTTSKQNIESLW